MRVFVLHETNLRLLDADMLIIDSFASSERIIYTTKSMIAESLYLSANYVVCVCYLLYLYDEDGGLMQCNNMQWSCGCTAYNQIEIARAIYWSCDSERYTQDRTAFFRPAQLNTGLARRNDPSLISQLHRPGGLHVRTRPPRPCSSFTG